MSLNIHLVREVFMRLLICTTMCLFFQYAAFTEELPADIKVLVDREIAELKGFTTDPTIVAAIKAYNAAPPSKMTNDIWKTLTLVSPEVKSIVKSETSLYLKSKKTPTITELFLNGADGGKVGFLSKTTAWNHSGKPKHDLPITGKTWIGSIEVDESSGAQQVQIAIPVLEGTKPIGSLVIGLGVAQMKEKQSK